MITPSAFPPQALEQVGEFKPDLAEEQKSGIHGRKSAAQAVAVIAWLANYLLKSLAFVKLLSTDFSIGFQVIFQTEKWAF